MLHPLWPSARTGKSRRMLMGLFISFHLRKCSESGVNVELADRGASGDEGQNSKGGGSQSGSLTPEPPIRLAQLPYHHLKPRHWSCCYVAYLET